MTARRSWRARAGRMAAPFLGVFIVVVIFTLARPDRPLDMRNFRLIVEQMAVVGIAGMGMTFVIASAGIDLSVGSIIALSSVTGALAVDAGWPLPLVVLAAVLTGALCGVYNGILITILRLPPFIATLGTMGFYRGFAKWISSDGAVRPRTDQMEAYQDMVYPLPEGTWIATSSWMMFALAFVLAFVMRRTLLGRYALAIGSNESTARLCGIRVPRTKIVIYGVSGVLCGLAGLVLFSRLTAGNPTEAGGLELNVIAAVVIGGGSLSGGQGSIVGTLAGAFMMAYLNNRCTVIGLPNYVEEIIVGHIVVIAVALDQWRRRRALRVA